MSGLISSNKSRRSDWLFQRQSSCHAHVAFIYWQTHFRSRVHNFLYRHKRGHPNIVKKDFDFSFACTSILIILHVYIGPVMLGYELMILSCFQHLDSTYITMKLYILRQIRTLQNTKDENSVKKKLVVKTKSSTKS